MPWLVLLIVLTLFVLTPFAIDLAGTSDFVEKFDLKTIPLVKTVSASIVDNHLVDKNFALSHYSYYAEPNVVGFLLGKTGPRARAVAKRGGI